MERSRNPYSPGAGLQPPALIGREAELEGFQALIERARLGRVGRAMALSGLRGVGKTVLLNRLADQAETAGWIVAIVEAHPGSVTREPFALQLARSMRTSLRTASFKFAVTERLRAALGTFKSFTVQLDPTGAVSAGFELDAARGRADSGYITADLADLASDLAGAAKDNKVGVGIFIDEMQDADLDVLAALCAASHRAAQHDLPFYVIGAGLPSLPTVLSEAVTYAERLFEYRTISHLHEAESRRVLIDPASAVGVQWEPEAVTLATAESGGYPYFLQEYGRAAWNAAPGPAITRADMLIAITDARQALDVGFFRSRWDRATPSERHYLMAMATDGSGPSGTGDVAARLQRSLGSLGPIRSYLITKGLIYSPRHGYVAYTVPGMADFVRREAE